MDLIRRRLRQNSAKRSRTASSRPTESAWTDAAKDTPPTPDLLADKEYDIAQRDYDLERVMSIYDGS